MTKWWGWREESQMTTRLSSWAAEATWYVVHQDRKMEQPVCKTWIRKAA